MNRIVSLLASMTLVLSLFSTAVFAEEGSYTSQSQRVSTASETVRESDTVTKEVTGVGVSSTDTTKSVKGSSTSGTQSEEKAPSEETKISEDSTIKDDETSSEETQKGDKESEVRSEKTKEDGGQLEKVSDDKSEQPSENGSSEEPSSGDEKVAIDRTKEVIKYGLHLSIRYETMNSSTSYIPRFTLALRTKDGKLISTVEAGPQNYNKDTMSYELVMKNPGYKLGEEYQIFLVKKDPIIKNLTIVVQYFKGEDLVTEKATLNVNNYYTFKIREVYYYEGEKETPVKGLAPSRDFPLEGEIQTDSSKVGIVLKNKQGAFLKQEPLYIKLLGGKELKLKSDNNGVVWVNSKDLTQFFLVYSPTKDVVCGNKKGMLELMYEFKGIQNSLVTYEVVLQDKVKNVSNIKETGVEVKTKVNGNTELSNNWVDADIYFTNSKGKTSILNINSAGGTISLPDGTYKVKAVSEYANVKLSSSTVAVKGGKTTLTATLSPKYVLQVDKDGKPYKFSVLNVSKVSNKVFSGIKALTFGVVPGESYMIQDKDSKQVYTVIIDKDSTLTRLVLGQGVVFGGTVSTPHTGDGIIFLVAMFFISLVGAGVSFLIFNKNKRLKTSALSILLVGTLLTSLLPMHSTPVKAADSGNEGGATIGSGSPVAPSYGRSTTAGLVQTDNVVSVLQVSFTNGTLPGGQNDNLNWDSSHDQLANPFKFSTDRVRNVFFMAVNKNSYDIFRRSTTSYALFNSNKIETIWGTNPFVKDTMTSDKRREEYGIKGSLSSRLLPLPEDAAKSSNAFERFLGEIALKLTSDVNNRQLWTGHKSESVINIGDLIGREYIDDIYKKLNSDNEKVQRLGQINNDRIFDDYIKKLRKIGQNDVAEMLVRDKNATKTDHIMLFQVVQGFYVKGAYGNQRKYMFMPMNDAVEWYLYGRKQENPSKFKSYKFLSGKTVPLTHKTEAWVLYGVPGDNGGSSKSKWARVAPTNTYVGNVRNTSAIALKPRTSKVPIIRPTTNKANLDKNGFAGWGFVNWGYEGGPLGNAPKIYAKYDVTVVNEKGVPTGEQFTVDVPGYEENSENYLSNPELEENGIWSNHLVVRNKNGKEYKILNEDNVPFTLTDIADGYNLLEIDGVQRTGVTSIPYDPSDPTYWALDFGFDIPANYDLDAVLGGTNLRSRLESRYKNNPNKKFSDALLVLKVKAMVYDIRQTEPPKVSHTVPEWRLSKYFKDISPVQKDKAMYKLEVPALTWENPALSPSGSTQFNLIDPDLKDVSWAYSAAKLFNDTPIRYISVYNRLFDFNLAGDLLAVKSNGSVDNVKLASWLGVNELFDGRIGSTSKGSEGQDSVVKTHRFIYGVQNPNPSYSYSETRYTTDREGNVVSYRWSGPATPEYKAAQYDVSVRFDRYKTGDRQAKDFDDKKQSVNGFYWETKQSNMSLKVNPEVLMVFDDKNGNTSVAFVAGDKLREIKPITYNVAQYVAVDVKPSVTGMSVATDAKAKALANRLGASNKGVVYKGSALTTNFQTKGQLQLKTFALDIGATALKNAWGNSSYSTDKLNEEFLSRYATKKSDGTWEVTLNAEGKLKINGIEYGGKKKPIKLKQVDRDVVEHTLAIRGGKLVSVDGNNDLNSLSSELKDALERMKISTPYGDNVFNAFERNGGNKLTEPLFATLGNQVRGTNDLAVNKGWYNEDSTVLVIREYTNTFELPQYMYTDKVPMEIKGLETPIDKNQFFSKGYVGHTKLRFTLVDSFMEYDSSLPNPFGGKFSKDFVVPNVSVMDSFQ